jgi:hypothetical protein
MRCKNFYNSKTMKVLSLLVSVLGAVNLTSHASLSVKADEQLSSDTKIRLVMVNTYTNTIQSARVALFFVDEKGSVVGQDTRWVIGGTKDRPPLPSQGTATYFVTIPTDKPFQKVDVIVTRIVLEGGQIIDAGNGFKLEK